MDLLLLVDIFIRNQLSCALKFSFSWMRNTLQTLSFGLLNVSTCLYHVWMHHKEPSDTRTCAFVKYHPSSVALISTQTQASFIHFLVCTLDKGYATMHLTLVSDNVRRLVLQSTEQQIHVCYGHWQLPTGFGIFLKSTSVCNHDLNQKPSRLSCCHQNQGPSEESISNSTSFWNVIGSPQTSKDKVKMAPQIAATPASHVPWEDYFSFTVLSKLRRMLPLRLYRKQLINILIKVTNDYCHVLLAYFLSTHEILGL